MSQSDWEGVCDTVCRFWENCVILVVTVTFQGIGSELGIWTFFLTIVKKGLANRMMELGFRTSDQNGIPLESPSSGGFWFQSPWS